MEEAGVEACVAGFIDIFRPSEEHQASVVPTSDLSLQFWRSRLAILRRCVREMVTGALHGENVIENAGRKALEWRYIVRWPVGHHELRCGTGGGDYSRLGCRFRFCSSRKEQTISRAKGGQILRSICDTQFSRDVQRNLHSTSVGTEQEWCQRMPKLLVFFTERPC
jgi:hypothetical protein